MADRNEIDEVRQRIDIVSLVEKYVTLKRSGRGLVGLCPFHQEKTPSFHVNPELGLWKCFGQCAEGGDVFKFVQKIENLSFREALERLALQAGVTLSSLRASPDPFAPADHSAGDEKNRLYRVNALALRFYQQSLRNSQAARNYLSARGVSEASIERFSLGFAPDQWGGLTAFLTQQKADPADAERAGLLSRNERGYFDRLRGRIIFPIYDVQERPIAFGGRILGQDGNGVPKYWNSPESPIFSKSRTLYGLERARKAIAESKIALVVEGYTDVVAAHQAGFENCVATLGTSLTEEHVKTLARLAPIVLLAFDADSAGLKAAFRAAAIFEAQEVDVRVIDLPQSEDPDSLLRAGRRREFQRAMDQAKSLTEYRVERLIRDSKPADERDSLTLFKKALPVLASIPSMIEREQFVKRLAPFHPQYRAGAAYAEEHIRQDIAAYQAGKVPPSSAPTWEKPRSALLPAPPPGAAVRAERQLLRTLISADAELAEIVLIGLSVEEYSTPTGRLLAGHLYRSYSEDFEPNMQHLLDELLESNPAAAQAFTDLLMDQEEIPLGRTDIQGAIAYLQQQHKRRYLSELRRSIEQGQADISQQREYDRLYFEMKGTQGSRHGIDRPESGKGNEQRGYN